MKILLANPPAHYPLPNGLEKYFLRAGSRWPGSVVKPREQAVTDYLPFPFYLAYTAALLKTHGLNVTTVDAIALNWSEEQFIAYAIREKPDVMLFESTTPTIKKDAQMLRTILSSLPDLTTCIAGSHVSTFPEETLRRFPEIDFVFIGEYEQPFLQFARTWQSLGRDKILMGAGDALAYLNNGQYVAGAKGLNRQLDLLPFPAWEMFPIQGANPWETYWDNICQLRPAAQMHASRGCPFRCDFCVWIQVMYNNSKYRPFSPDRIIDEMAALIQRYGVREIYFDDDIFTGSKPQVLDFCRRLKERCIPVRWSVMGDAMICDEEMLEVMADAGCIAMKFGVESGDTGVLREINKPINLAKVERVCNTANRLGIKTHATFSFGLSGETHATMRNTWDFMHKLDADTIQVSITTPFPGTRFYQKAKQNGYLLTEDWELFDGNHTSVISNEHITHEEVEQFATMARTRWLRSRLLRWTWLRRQWRILRRISEGQGLRGLAKLFVAGWRILSGQQHRALKTIVLNQAAAREPIPGPNCPPAVSDDCNPAENHGRR